MKNKLRRIVVDGRTFLWTRSHHHFLGNSGRICEERLKIYAAGYKKSPLQLVFGQNETWEAGYPADGVVWRKDIQIAYNLNRPAVIRALIQHALGETWSPESASQSLDLSDGFAILIASKAPTGLG